MIAVLLAAIAVFSGGCTDSGESGIAPVESSSPSDLNSVGPTPEVNQLDDDSNQKSTIITYYDPGLASLYRINLNYVRDGMHVYVTANIVGGPSSHEKMNCLRTNIQWGDESGLVVIGDCVPYVEGDKFNRAHRFDYIFENEGDAKIVFTYGDLPPVSTLVHVDENTSSPGILTPEKALKQPEGTHVHVWGSVFFDSVSQPGMCGEVFDRSTPQCVPLIEIKNLPTEMNSDLVTDSDVFWIQDPVVLSGSIQNGVLTVEHWD